LLTGQEIRTFAYSSIITAISPNDQYAFSINEIAMFLWNVDMKWEIPISSTEDYANKFHRGWVKSILISSNGRYALSASPFKGSIKLWNLDTRIEMNVGGYISYNAPLAISHDGQYVLSGSTNNTLKFWDLATSNEIFTFDHPKTW